MTQAHWTATGRSTMRGLVTGPARTPYTPGPTRYVDLHRRADGCVVIGNAPAAAAGIGLAPTRGGLVTVDPVDPGALSVLVPASPDDECLEVLAALLGEDAAAAVRHVAVTGESHTAVLVPSLPVREDVARLGVLQWATRHCAVGLAQPLLTVEQLTLSTRLASVMDPDWPGERDLRAWTGTIVEWARRARAIGSPWPRHPVVAALLQDALGALGETLPLADARLGDLDHERDLLAPLGALGLSHLGVDARPEWLTELRPHAAMAHRGSDSGQLDGTGAVDWARVPPGLTSRAEDAVSWRIRRHDEAYVLTVIVKAPAITPDLALLVTPTMPMPPMKIINASVYQGDWPLPLVVAGLDFRAEAGAWMGSQHVSAAVLERLSDHREGVVDVDVHEAGSVPPRRGRGPRQAAAAQRWAARGATTMRLAGIATGQARQAWRDTAVQAWSRAARVYAGLPDEVGGAQRAQCLAVLSTLGGDGTRTRPAWRRPDSDPVRATASVDQSSPVSAAEVWFALSHD